MTSGRTASVTSAPFGRLPSGREVRLFTLTNARGMVAAITDYGGIMTRLLAPDRAGRLDDIVLGYDRLEQYLALTPYFGAIIGRYGNRIAGGRFTLDGRTYALATNNEPAGRPCALHGGLVGFDKVVWDAEPVRGEGRCGLQLRHLSRDGEEGYPGNLDVTVWYWLTDGNELHVEYRATTDRATPVNLTQHNYYNLRGHGDVLGHVLTLHASHYTPVDPGLIPVGRIAPVAGTPLDFRAPAAIGARIGADDEQLRFARGYDHNWIIDRAAPGLVPAAEAYEPETGRVLEVLTEEPALQFYSGNFLEAAYVGKGGVPCRPHAGFCLETQHFPDSPNQPVFPSTILRPGGTYRSTTVHRFSTR